MFAELVSRETESASITKFLDTAAAEPAGLVVEGERGIGKTSLWLDGISQARHRGWQVLTTRPVESESVLAYASLADLLGGVDPGEFAKLPAPQRLAVDQVLLSGDAADVPTDRWAVAAAFFSVVDGLSEAGPVLIAVDDLQWLDRSSEAVVAFAARRLSGPVGVLATLRTQPDNSTAASWLVLPRPDAIERITVGPLSLGALHALLSARLGRSYSRPTILRIRDVSGGNPFYALELARAVAGVPAGDDMSIPSTLSELVGTRIGALDAAVEGALLAAACAGAPTVEMIARATDTPAARVVNLLAEAEDKGIIGYDGERLRFGHPLLAAGVYADASPSRRRAMHRRLAGIVTEPELQARHLALAATTADQHTLQSLDAAAKSAAKRGAPAAAAELLDLAVGLGGDTAERRIRAAEHHLYAANFGEAGTRLEQIIETLAPGRLRAVALNLLAEVRVAEEDYNNAATSLERAVADSDTDLERRTRALVLLSFTQLNLVQISAAESSVDRAVTHATSLGETQLLSQALGFQAMVRFVAGRGFDEQAMAYPVGLEAPSSGIPLSVRATAQNALLLAWTGQLDRGHEAMSAIRQRCIERGEEHELMTIDFHSVWIAIWRGDFSAAALLAEDAFERARTLSRAHSMSAALTMQAAVCAYTGREDRVRHAVDDALAYAQRYGAPISTRWTITAMGFVEVSLGNYPAALGILEPMLQFIAAAPVALEIGVAPFVPDAAETLIALGRLDEAEKLLDRFERDGRALDRAWILACGGRCRAMLLAARGDVESAAQAAQQAMVEHERLPMPFERTRTQLLLGQLQRRQRRKEASASTLHEALDTFEQLGAPLWADRARAELGRADIRPRRVTALTPSEHRVAALAASGMTNRGVAAAMFISPKTVEANLARVYAKLGIHSRAELGRHMSRSDG